MDDRSRVKLVLVVTWLLVIGTCAVFAAREPDAGLVVPVTMVVLMGSLMAMGSVSVYRRLFGPRVRPSTGQTVFFLLGAPTLAAIVFVIAELLDHPRLGGVLAAAIVLLACGDYFLRPRGASK
ncbi:MAG: hypothetical protein AB1625_05865 [Acidobacteriota bacterium]